MNERFAEVFWDTLKFPKFCFSGSKNLKQLNFFLYFAIIVNVRIKKKKKKKTKPSRIPYSASNQSQRDLKQGS